jgi:hypothetical protein
MRGVRFSPAVAEELTGLVFSHKKEPEEARCHEAGTWGEARLDIENEPPGSPDPRPAQAFDVLAENMQKLRDLGATEFVIRFEIMYVVIVHRDPPGLGVAGG